MIVLGAAAGGGFPQWNSNAPGCRRARLGDEAARPRTQTSVAVSADGLRWLLLNASPDLRQQIEATPSLQPTTGLRSSPIVGIALTGADVDAIAGLLHMRERHRFAVYATRRVHGVLRSNSIFSVLAEDCVRREIVQLEGPFIPTDMEGVPLGFSLEFFPVPGKIPLYLERDGNAAAERQTFAGEPEDNVGVEIIATAAGESARILFIPGCAEIDEAVQARLQGASVVFFDGTLWRDEEMITLGLGEKTGRRMGHMSVDGPAGTIAALRNLAIGRRIFVHINNSNPILLDDSPERATTEAAGWEVAWDGMEIRQ
jgi:pyrroloquinoline quinone biosynthesis protein B